MNEDELLQKIEKLSVKLNRAQLRVSGLREKSKCLEMQYDDSRLREKNTNDLVMELLERQRELNVMLNRANIMLNRTQEAMALTSMEFNEMAKALPEPKKEEWADRVSKINDLFKKTGIQDAEVMGLQASNPLTSDSFETDELKQESESAFKRIDSIWQRAQAHQPPKVEAELLDENEQPRNEPCERESEEITVVMGHSEPDHADLEESSDENDSTLDAQKKSWWQKIAG